MQCDRQHSCQCKLPNLHVQLVQLIIVHESHGMHHDGLGSLKAPRHTLAQCTAALRAHSNNRARRSRRPRSRGTRVPIARSRRFTAESATLYKTQEQ